jgi:long-chain acyl-CoA synthetase
VVGASRMTWGDVDRAADSCAAGLVARGISPGDRIGLFLGNRPEFVIAFFGALRAGAVVVPVNPALTAPEVSQLAEHVGPSLVVVDRSTADTAAQAVAGVPQVVAAGGLGDGSFDALLAAGSGVAVPVPRGGESLAVVVYTSGTGGDAKGAMLSHRALIANVEQVAQARLSVAEPDDVVLLLLPLTHIYSLAGTLGAVVRAAATAVLVDGVDVVRALPLVRQYGVTNVPGAPALWAAWAASSEAVDALDGLRIAFSGSAALPPEVQHRVHTLTGWYVHEGYGLTEAAPGVSSTVVSGRAKPGSVGQPFPGVEVRLVDDDGDEIDPAEGDPGEIWIRGDNLFSGYWPDGSGGPDADGWYATGDVAFADEEGDLHIVDRRKDVVIVSGFNVYPHEVETVLLQHPGVREAAAIGVPDDRTGEAVKAFVVLRDRSVTTGELQEHAAARLARFKRPTAIEVVDDLPHSLTGKVARGRLERGERTAQGTGES